MLITCRYITTEPPIKVPIHRKYESIFGLSSYNIKDFLKNIKTNPLFSPRLDNDSGVKNVNISDKNEQINT